ncbi:nitroreductase [Halosimplex carlsbadense 2-9-1]|uniref:Nitroreductase n=1 Tax=Halosimplex carlsbadense 2-9-1 TaxID=797114 RepID=M0CR37_9EURY|nr:nitroreductase family protein [Halosimplex carlsbadense]ELZ24862.1 nitroreductase [Halosimplex carlsbadense 2-9-1]
MTDASSGSDDGDEERTAADGGEAVAAERSPLTELTPEVAEHRDPDHDVAPVFVNRWSPRAMTGESVAEADLLALFEAARWAPSSRNNQHWRFVYAERDDEAWESYLDLLAEGNRTWAVDAGALLVVVSKTTFDYNGEPAGTHSFDTGAAWQNLALEATRRGLATHPIGGFDHEGAAELVDLPDEFEVEAMVAVGHRGDPETLPEDLREREVPKGRKPVEEITFEGRFDDDGD